ncbi:hypothetical protein [Haloactinopolyspora sp.]|uniref:hypothetical protein n=1 Tax=Haloactinopolyspora sp. TaxID=1966353 RepID=UPI00262846D7|nr:hypothetical protein [Haloactinopolyspora sp.]
MRRVMGVAAGVSVLIGLLITAFVWPNSQIEPRDVPLVVAGPAATVAAVQAQLDETAPGAFEVEAVADADAARQVIVDNRAYGAVVVDSTGPPRILTATAASPAVASMLQSIADQMATGEAASGVEDVVPLPADDPRGSGFNGGALPMVMGGLAVGFVMALAVTGLRRRFYGATLAAAGGGAVAALVMHSWLGVLDGSWWAEAGAFALAIAAVSFTVLGLQALVGRAGLGLAGLVIMLVGNPLSGVTSAPEMLPSGWGALGQALPPGAGGRLLRSVAYFDGAGAGGPVLVLSLWIAGALLAAGVGAAVAGRRQGQVAVSDGTTNRAVPVDH